MHEFRYGAILKAFIYIFSPVFIGLFVWTLFHFSNENAMVYFLLVVPAAISMIALFAYGIADVTIGKVIVTDSLVTLRSPLGSRSLLINEIRGFRQDENYIRIVPMDASKKEVKISKFFKG